VSIRKSLSWLLLMLLPGIVFAVPLPVPNPLPSSISGVYLGPDRACRVELYRAPNPQFTRVETACVLFAGGVTESLTEIYTPGGQCPTSSAAWVFDGYRPAQRGYYSMQAFDAGATLSVVLSTNPTSASNGVGTLQTWQLVQSVTSRAPYSCAQPGRDKR